MTFIPTVHGIIERRILVNYRVDPERLAKILPDQVRPQVFGGYGIAGICLIRLKNIRPRFIPAALGLSSENAAHRIAVEWAEDGQLRTGVYVPRRDTSSGLNALLGSRLFSSLHHLAQFDVRETGHEFKIAVKSRDGLTQVAVTARTVAELPPDSVFASTTEASNFFRCGGIGISPSARNNEFDAIELKTSEWNVQPMAVDSVQSRLFDDRDLFPEGTACFDSALLMRDVPHSWHAAKFCPGDLNSVPADGPRQCVLS